MTLRHIPSIPVASVIQSSSKKNELAANNANAYLMQINFEFLSEPVTGSDGEIYTWRDENHRTGFNDSSAGYHTGNPTGLGGSDGGRWYLQDKVGKHGSYICKLGFDKDQKHRWLSNVVGFDMSISTFGTSAASTNETFLGRLGMIYINPLTGQEFIYKPTVTMSGPTGDIPNNSTYSRVVRKLQENSGPWRDVHELDLRFTGFIFEWGHQGGGGAVPTTVKLFFAKFIPLTTLDVDTHVYIRADTNIGFYELIPRMRYLHEIDDIEYDTFDI